MKVNWCDLIEKSLWLKVEAWWFDVSNLWRKFNFRKLNFFRAVPKTTTSEMEVNILKSKGLSRTEYRVNPIMNAYKLLSTCYNKKCENWQRPKSLYEKVHDRRKTATVEWHTQNVTKCVLRIQCVLNIKRWIFRIHKYRRTQWGERRWHLPVAVVVVVCVCVWIRKESECMFGICLAFLTYSNLSLQRKMCMRVPSHWRDECLYYIMASACDDIKVQLCVLFGCLLAYTWKRAPIQSRIRGIAVSPEEGQTTPKNMIRTLESSSYTHGGRNAQPKM